MGKIIKKVVGAAKVGVGLYTGNYAMALGGAGDLAGGGGGGGGGTAQGNTANGAYFDYFAKSRPQYGDRLNTLMGYGGTPGTAGTTSGTPMAKADWLKANGYGSGRSTSAATFVPRQGVVYNPVFSSSKPGGEAAYKAYVAGYKPTTTAGTPGVSGTQAAINEVMNSPGYMGGMREGQRTLAAGLARTGQVGSGAEQIAYGNLGQDYFRKSYQDLFNQYASLSGATQQPLTMASANQLGADQSRLQDQALAQSLGALGGGIKDIFSSSSNNANINANPSGYSSGDYAPGASSYSPTDTNIGMGGYTGPANMGGGLVGPNWGSS